MDRGRLTVGGKKSQRDNQRLRFYIFFLLIITDGVFWHVLCFVSLWMKSCNHPTDALFLLAEVVRSVSLGVVIWPNHWHLPSPSWPLTWATACALARWPAIMKSTMAAGQCMCVSESPCAHECVCVCHFLWVDFSVSNFSAVIFPPFLLVTHCSMCTLTPSDLTSRAGAGAGWVGGVGVVWGSEGG